MSKYRCVYQKFSVHHSSKDETYCKYRGMKKRQIHRLIQKLCVDVLESQMEKAQYPGISCYLVSRSKQVNKIITYSWTGRKLSCTGTQGGKIVMHKTRTLETWITNLTRWNLCRGVIFLSNFGWYFLDTFSIHIYHKKSFLLMLTTVGRLCHFLVRMRWLDLWYSHAHVKNIQNSTHSGFFFASIHRRILPTMQKMKSVTNRI